MAGKGATGSDYLTYFYHSASSHGSSGMKVRGKAGCEEAPRWIRRPTPRKVYLQIMKLGKRKRKVPIWHDRSSGSSLGGQGCLTGSSPPHDGLGGGSNESAKVAAQEPVRVLHRRYGKMNTCNKQEVP